MFDIDLDRKPAVARHVSLLGVDGLFRAIHRDGVGAFRQLDFLAEIDSVMAPPRRTDRNGRPDEILFVVPDKGDDDFCHDRSSTVER